MTPTGTPPHEVVAHPVDAAGTVLFSPGAVGAGSLWRATAEGLGDRWRTVLVDLVAQPARSGPQGVGALAADVVAVADRLGADTFWHVGVGVGGAVGQELALQWPDRLAGLGLVATAAVLDEGALAALAAEQPGDDVHVPAVVRTFDTRGWLDQVAVPTLVVAASDDPVFGPYAAEVLAAGIPGARLEVLGGGRHLVVERAGELTTLLRDHLAR